MSSNIRSISVAKKTEIKCYPLTSPAWCVHMPQPNLFSLLCVIIQFHIWNCKSWLTLFVWKSWLYPCNLPVMSYYVSVPDLPHSALRYLAAINRINCSVYAVGIRLNENCMHPGREIQKLGSLKGREKLVGAMVPRSSLVVTHITAITVWNPLL